ncbi:7965_t:CDS:1, partial [Dentiscutata erythropus]
MNRERVFEFHKHFIQTTDSSDWNARLCWLKKVLLKLNETEHIHYEIKGSEIYDILPYIAPEFLEISWGESKLLTQSANIYRFGVIMTE